MPYETPNSDSGLEEDPFLPPGEDPDEDLEEDPFLPPGEDPDESDSDDS
jgi:hypothetical protein